MQPPHVVPEKRKAVVLSYPTFDLGLTPTPEPVHQPSFHVPTEQVSIQQPYTCQPPSTNEHSTCQLPTHQASRQQPPVLQPIIRTSHKPISSYPSFDLGITPPSDDDNRGISSQTTASPHVPVSQTTDASDPSYVPSDPACAQDSDPTVSDDLPLSQANEASDPSNEPPAKSIKVYELRRSKRVPKPKDCGTKGKKCLQKK